MISPSPISGKARRHGLAAAFGYAFAGLRAAWRGEPNLRIHVAVAAAVLVGGALLRLRPLAWGLVVFAIALVLVAELVNAAIESVVDLVSPDDHPLAGRAKDVAAAAVLIAALAAVAIGALVLVSVLHAP
ncbi:MAG TPA: diacylglycerol kinase [Candidatus Limnocylindria bacterium]|jgi:diacylglycerol kinase (ATP)|nr:diacylglycerol kinase [Candidatus Limnocylindria bacterium]